MNTDSIPFKKQTMYLVEANSFEILELWKDFAKQSEKLHPNKSTRYDWKQQNPGCFEKIGYIQKRPICIMISWYVINSCCVGFWEATSELVDYKMIARWLKENFDCAGTDANNFHICLQEIDRKNKEKELNHKTSQLTA